MDANGGERPREAGAITVKLRAELQRSKAEMGATGLSESPIHVYLHGSSLRRRHFSVSMRLTDRKGPVWR